MSLALELPEEFPRCIKCGRMVIIEDEECLGCRIARDREEARLREYRNFDSCEAAGYGPTIYRCEPASQDGLGQSREEGFPDE